MEEKTNKSGVGRTVAIALLGFFCVVASEGLDFMSTNQNSHQTAMVSVLDGATTGEVHQEGDVYTLTSSSKEPLNFALNNYTAVRLSPDSQINLNDNFHLSLTKGRVWINSQNSADILTVSAGPLEVTVRPGIADIHLSQETIIVSAHEHPLTIQFFSRTIVVPEGMMVKMARSKLEKNSKEIAKLYYSKLVKEFPLELLSTKGAWETYNSSLDTDYKKKLRDAYISVLRQVGPGLLDDNSDGFITQVTNTLTFDESKKTSRVIRTALKIFDKSFYLYLTGKENEARAAMDDFVAVMSGRQFNEDMTSQMKEKLAQISFATEQDSFFSGKGVLKKVLYVSASEKLAGAFDEVLDVARAGSDAETQSKVLGAFRRFSAISEKETATLNGENAHRTLFVLNTILIDFFHKYHYVLRQEFMSIIEKLEDKLIAVTQKTDEQVDLRHFIVSEKLGMIKELENELLLSRGDFDQIRDVIIALARRIETMRPALFDSAFVSYLDDQYSQLTPLLSFMRSSAAQRMHGSADFKKSFDEYQLQVHESSRVRDLLQESDGGKQISSLRREALASVLAVDLGDLFQDIQVALPESELSAQVKIVSAQFEGKTLTSMYDVERKIFSEIQFDGNSIPNAVRLSNIKQFLLVAMGQLILAEGQKIDSLVEQPEVLSLLQKVAREKLIDKLQKVRITIDQKYVDIKDYETGVVHVRLAQIGEGSESKVFSFDIDSAFSTISLLKVQSVKGEIPVNDTFSVTELPLKVEQIYARALFEKQQELEQNLPRE